MARTSEHCRSCSQSCSIPVQRWLLCCFSFVPSLHSQLFFFCITKKSWEWRLGTRLSFGSYMYLFPLLVYLLLPSPPLPSPPLPPPPPPLLPLPFPSPPSPGHEPPLTEWEYFPHVGPRPMKGFVGLKNAGATCYMNAVLQQVGC